MNRRKYLGGLIALSAPLVSGCTSDFSFISSGRAKLGDINILNYDDEPHTLHILVEESNELVHWSSHHLEPADHKGNFASLENTWGGNDRRDTLYARRDQRSSWKKTDLSNLPEGETFDFDVGIQDDGEITFAMSPVQNN